MNHKASGFTLVELAIVLVIISLLMGGILKGQELITSAKVKSLGNDFRSVAAAYYGYQDRFRAAPGDDLHAGDHVGATNSGNGNGQINGWWLIATGTDTTAESINFWQHVRLANLLTGSTTVAAGYMPTNASGGQIGITGTNPDSTTSSTFAGTFYVCSNNIDGKSAKQLDNMLDDGNTATGSLRVFAASPAAASTPKALADVTDGALFSVCIGY
ncbi:MAG: prepilin-type N-terminal cleavage/methylation domain-containing protein [Rhodocyclaceae bacterium]|nr:prepilin-type N-terminal cleavage/methylation domain-containing protein [Rhodocyclaceae bacterium]